MTSTPEVMNEAMQRAQSEVADRQKRPFAEVRARRSVEELLRNIQQALVAYTGQADLKANMVSITSPLASQPKHLKKPLSRLTLNDGVFS